MYQNFPKEIIIEKKSNAQVKIKILINLFNPPPKNQQMRRWDRPQCTLVKNGQPKALKKRLTFIQICMQFSLLYTSQATTTKKP